VDLGFVPSMAFYKFIVQLKKFRHIEKVFAVVLYYTQQEIHGVIQANCPHLLREIYYFLKGVICDVS